MLCFDQNAHWGLVATYRWLTFDAALRGGEVEQLLELEKQVFALKAARRLREAEPLAKRMVASAANSFQQLAPTFVLQNLADLYCGKLERKAIGNSLQ